MPFSVIRLSATVEFHHFRFTANVDRWSAMRSGRPLIHRLIGRKGFPENRGLECPRSLANPNVIDVRRFSESFQKISQKISAKEGDLHSDLYFRSGSCFHLCYCPFTFLHFNLNFPISSYVCLCMSKAQMKRFVPDSIT